MLVETWVAAVMMLCLFIIGIALVISGILQDERLEKERKKVEALMEENAELKRYIAVQKTKGIIGVANDFYYEGSKK